MTAMKLYGCPNTRSLHAAWALEETGADLVRIRGAGRRKTFWPIPVCRSPLPHSACGYRVAAIAPGIEFTKSPTPS